MKIIALDVESCHGDVGGQRMYFFRATDDSGTVHQIGPVFTTDHDFSAEVYRAEIIAKIEESLGESGDG